MSARLNHGEAAALEPVDAELVARWVERLRAHSSARLGLVELGVMCAAFVGRTEAEALELYAARLALASFSDRHPGVELVELVELFAEALEGLEL